MPGAGADQGRVGEQREVGHEAELEERRPDDFRVVVVELDRQQEPGARVAGRVAATSPRRPSRGSRSTPRRRSGGQLGEQPVGELGVDVAERHFLEGGDAEGVLGARVGARRDEDEQRRPQLSCLVRVAQLHQLGAGHRDLGGDERRRAEHEHLGAVAHGGADPLAQPDRERRLRVGHARAVAGLRAGRAGSMSRGVEDPLQRRLDVARR